METLKLKLKPELSQDVPWKDPRTPGSLPTFGRYTIDVRLKQFREVAKTGKIKFHDMREDKGDKILMQISRKNSALFMNIMSELGF